MTGLAHNKSKAVKTMTLSFLFTACTALIPLSAQAQFTQPLQEPATQNGGTPFAPPIGSGATPTPEITGDQGIGAPPNVPTGMADQTSGNSFPQGTANDRTEVFVYRQTTGGALGQSRGTRMVMTIRPDQLSATELSQITGVLGVNMETGLQSMDVTATDAQIAQIENILAPYPQTQNNGGKNQIVADAPNAAYPKAGEENSYDFQGPLPTVRTFCRYLVILGVVCATVFMSLAAWSMVLGQRDGASRVVGTAGGFMLLLMGYTIWKIVQMNTFGAMSNLPVVNQNRPTQATVPAANLAQSTVPGIPNGGGRAVPARTNMPVAPLLGVPGH